MYLLGRTYCQPEATAAIRVRVRAGHHRPLRQTWRFVFVDMPQTNNSCPTPRTHFHTRPLADIEIASTTSPHTTGASVGRMPSMEYNPRMSMAGGRSVSSQQQKKVKEPDEDAFMTLVSSAHLSTTRAQD